MRQELYYYATSLKDKGLNNVPNICLWILLSIFLVPIVLSDIMLGLILFFSYAFLSFLSQRESDRYNKDLLKMGLFLLFLGAEFFVLTLIQHRVVISFVIAIVTTLSFYEIFLFVRLRRKIYSNYTRNKSDRINIISNIISLMFGVTGIWAGKLIAKNENIDFKLWIAFLLCSLIIMYSFTFFQRFFIHKIIR